MDVVVTSYEMVIREQTAFRKFAWRYLIVDEAHRMKNEESKLSQVLRSFDSHSRLLITGTPHAEQPARAVGAAQLPAARHLHVGRPLRRVVRPLRQEGRGGGDLAADHKLLRPFLLRRVKTDVEGSASRRRRRLIVYTQLSPMQREQYKNILKRDMDALVPARAGGALTRTSRGC